MTTYSTKAQIPQAELTDAPNIQTYANALGTALDGMVTPTYATRTSRDAANPSPSDGDECYVTADKRQYLYYNAQWNNQTILRVQTLQSFSSLNSTFVTVTFPIAFEFAPNVMTNIASGSGTAATWISRADVFTTTDFRIYLARPDGATATWSNIPVWYWAL